MGTNSIADIECAYCGKLNEEIFYAPSSEEETFICEHCGKENLIVEKLTAEKFDIKDYEKRKKEYNRIFKRYKKKYSKI